MKRIFLTSVAANILKKIIRLIDVQNPSVAFIANAADLYSDKWFVEIDRDKFIELWFKIIDVDICKEKYDEILRKLESVDVIFIAGGNVFYLSQEMKKNGIDVLIKTLVENWKTYIWSSAWSVLAWPDIGIVRNLDDPKDATDLNSYEWMNLINYSIIPHCDNIKFKNKIEKIFKDNVNYKYPIIKLNDNQAVFIEWNKICFLEDSI